MARNELNAVWPLRDKSSDGCCGDAAHASRKSDHNAKTSGPSKGLATAYDYDEDVVGTMGDRELTGMGLVLLGDRRTKYCLDPSSRVLCADLQWRPIGDLETGQRIVAFDEFGSDRAWKRGEARTRGAQMRTGTIESSTTLRLPSVQVTTERGAVKCSRDHMWLVRPRVGQRHRRWVRADDLTTTDEIVYLADPWAREGGLHAGWIGGMFDGEGCLSRPTANDKLWGWCLSVSQRPGPVLEHMKRLLREFDVDFGESRNGAVNSLQIRGGLPAILRFVGRFPTLRLHSAAVDREIWDGAQIGKSFTSALVKHVEPVGLIDVTSVQTSTRTLIAEGYLSHNCIYEGQLLYPDGTVKPYHGVNPHKHHLHQSIHDWAARDTSAWGIARAFKSMPPARPINQEDDMSAADVQAINEHTDARVQQVAKDLLTTMTKKIGESEKRILDALGSKP